MKLLSPLKAGVCALVLLRAAAFAAVEPVAVLPPDALFCVSVIHPEKLQALVDHPVSKAVKLGGLKEILGKAFAGLINEKDRKIWQDECGMPPEAVLRKFSGSLAAGVFGADLKKRTPKGHIAVELGGAAGFEGDEALAAGIFKALARLNAPAEAPKKKDDDNDAKAEEPGGLTQMLSAKEQLEEHGGTKIHVLAPEKLKDEDVEALAWCVQDKTLFVATGAEPLRDMLDRASGKGGSSFLESRTWKTARDETGDPDALMAADIGGFLKVFLEEEKEAATQKIFRLIGADRLEILALGIRSDAKALETKIAVTYSSMPPVFDLYKRDKAEAPPFLPENLRGITWCPVNLKTTAEAILHFLPTMEGPTRQQIEQTLANLKELSGVDFEKEILGRMGTGYFQADHGFDAVTMEDLAGDDTVGKLINIIAPKKEGAVVGARLTDGRAFESAVRAIFSKIGKSEVQFDAREYMGFKIHRAGGGAAARKDADTSGSPEVSFTVADDWLLIAVGRQELLERVLGLIKNPSPSHLWKRPEVQRSIDSISGEGIYTRYEDMNETGRTLILVLAGIAGHFPGMENFRSVDTSELLKGVEFPLHHVEKMFIEPRVFRAHGRYMVRPDSE